MISQCFSATKNVRAKTKGRQIAIKRIKSARVRKDRRIHIQKNCLALLNAIMAHTNYCSS